MSAEKVIIKAQKRSLDNKSHAKKIRNEGFVLGNLSSQGKSTPIQLSEQGLPAGHQGTKLLTLELDGVEKLVFMRDVQVHPVSLKVQHIDLQEVDAKQHVRLRVPLKYVGLTREQEKDGAFKTLLRSLEVKAIASKIPESIEVSVGHLAVDQTVHMSDITAIDGVKFIASKNLALASLVRI